MGRGKLRKSTSEAERTNSVVQREPIVLRRYLILVLFTDIQTGLEKPQVEDFIDFQQTHRSEKLWKKTVVCRKPGWKGSDHSWSSFYYWLSLVPTTYFAWCVYPPKTYFCMPRPPSFQHATHVHPRSSGYEYFLGCMPGPPLFMLYVRPRSSGYEYHTCAKNGLTYQTPISMTFNLR